MNKAINSFAIQIRIEKIDLPDFLFRRRVFGVTSANCFCEFFKQTVKHVLMFCSEHSDRTELRAGGPMDFRRLVETNSGIKAAATWLMKTKILKQYAVAEVLLQDDE